MMVTFELTDDGVYVACSEGAGDLRAKIEYTKLPYLKDMPPEERKQFGAILEVVISRLRAELAMQANATSMQKLKALAPVVIPPPEKKLIVPGG